MLVDLKETQKGLLTILERLLESSSDLIARSDAIIEETKGIRAAAVQHASAIKFEIQAIEKDLAIDKEV